MDPTPTRKSGRGRIPNKKYEDDTIEILNRVLSSDSSEDEFLQELQAAEPRGDGEFNANTIISLPSDTETTSSGASDSSDIATPVEDYEDAESYADSSDEVETQKVNLGLYRRTAKVWNQKPKQPKGDTHSRGLPENPIIGFHKISRLGPLAGPADEDQLPVVQSMKQWGDDVTLPRRSRMRYPFTHTDEKRNAEATKGWDWYHEEGGRYHFAKRQKMGHVSADEAVRYLPGRSQVGHDVLLGPYGQQKPFHLPTFQSLNADDAWNEASASPHDNDGHESRKRLRHGWLLNVGASVRCLDWAPNQNGETQYLALVAKESEAKEVVREAPAFTPAPSSLSCIQIWAFSSLPDKMPSDSTLDATRPPELRQVLCTEWGDAKQLKWCPMPRRFKDEDLQGRIQLGLIAGVFDDGSVRVMEVSLEGGQDGHRPQLKVDSAAITIPPLTNTICTCLCWLSQTNIALGHSNGFLAAYSINPRTESPPQPSTIEPAESQSDTGTQSPGTDTQERPPTPWLIHRIHQTYVTSLTPAYPSFPTYLASTSISGHTRLTSLLQPTVCYAQSRRTHMPPNIMCYHHALHGCIFPDDSRELVSFTGLRFWGSNIGVAEATGAGGVKAVDVGKVHPSTVFGCADGSVVVTNPIRKVIKGTEKVWQLTVFRHEWARKPSKPLTKTTGESDFHRRVDANDGREAGTESQADDVTVSNDRPEPGGQAGDAIAKDTAAFREGTSRITESYKVYKADVENNAAARSIIVAAGKSRGSTTLTIYEEETGVTAVCWNPNLHCGGWLAAGWGSGLLRVDDVAI